MNSRPPPSSELDETVKRIDQRLEEMDKRLTRGRRSRIIMFLLGIASRVDWPTILDVVSGFGVVQTDAPSAPKPSLRACPTTAELADLLRAESSLADLWSELGLDGEAVSLRVVETFLEESSPALQILPPDSDDASRNTINPKRTHLGTNSN